MNSDEHEWQAQETAAECVKSGRALHELDSTSASYVALTRALRAPIKVQLPTDFAERIAALAGARMPVAEIESSLEQRLLLILVVVMGIAAVAVMAIYGGSWLGTSINLAGQLAKPSLLLGLLGCLAVSGLSQQLHRMFARTTPGAA